MDELLTQQSFQREKPIPTQYQLWSAEPQSFKHPVVSTINLVHLENELLHLERGWSYKRLRQP